MKPEDYVGKRFIGTDKDQIEWDNNKGYPKLRYIISYDKFSNEFRDSSGDTFGDNSPYFLKCIQFLPESTVLDAIYGED